MYSPKKVVSPCIALLGLAAVAVIVTTGTVAATPRLNTMAAAPTSPSIPVVVTNTPLPVTGTLSVGGSVNANITNSALKRCQLGSHPVVCGRREQNRRSLGQ
jgi:hypothetical protein